jgi:hypothetical protein
MSTVSKEVKFKREKETKNMVRFSEVVEDDTQPFVRTVYVPKYWIKDKNNLTITYSYEEI